MSVLDKVKEKLAQTFIPESQRPAAVKLPVDDLKIGGALKVLEDYKSGKANFDKRIIENDKWYRMRHWDQIRAESEENKPEPTSAWLFNSLLNKHADIMDNFPEPQVLPREESDKKEAETISAILPVILKRAKFENTYSLNGWKKLKNGIGIYGTFWDNSLENGLGNIAIKKINPLNLFWEPGIEDIQESSNVFLVALINNDKLLAKYPQLKDKLGSAPESMVGQFEHNDEIDTSNKSAVIDWYYKQSMEAEDGSIKDILHFCKFCNGVVLESTENDPKLHDKGLYDHARYPFTFDVLFPEEDTPAGFGYVDVMKDPQIYIDKLDQIIMLNAFEAGVSRVMLRDDVGINETELMDPSKRIIHVTKGGFKEDNYKVYETKPLDPYIINHRTNKIEELKETSGNRDFSQGSTASGVTAASAIAALQEAGSKGSRDNIGTSYTAFEEINNFCVELIRQFYTEPRKFRITNPNGKDEFVTYTSQGIQDIPQLGSGGETIYRRPIFDIEIRAQKASPFSTIAMNEMAKELYYAGFFNPQMADQALMALDMMSFDGKNSIVSKISQNSTLVQTSLKLAQIVDSMTGTSIMPQLAQQYGVSMPQSDIGGMMQTNILGRAVQAGTGGIVTNAKQTAANVASPR